VNRAMTEQSLREVEEKLGKAVVGFSTVGLGIDLDSPLWDGYANLCSAARIVQRAVETLE